MGLFGNKKKLLVGLDIGSSGVKVCELQAVGKGSAQRYRLQKLGAAPVPHDAIVDGDIMDSNAVANAIRQVLAEQKIKSREVAISVSGQQVMVKKVTFPLMSPAELAESVRWGSGELLSCRPRLGLLRLGLCRHRRAPRRREHGCGPGCVPQRQAGSLRGLRRPGRSQASHRGCRCLQSAERL